MASNNYLNPMTEETLKSMSPADARDRLIKGNVRFIEKVDGRNEDDRDLRDFINTTSSKGQFPFAIVLSCIDSRMPTETLFDQSIGDIFNARIAGNFVNVDILGGMEFACTRVNSKGQSIGAKLIVVMGHTSCGAISGAFQYVYPQCFSKDETENEEKQAAPNNLVQMLRSLTPAIKTTRLDKTQCRDSKYQKEFVDKAAHKNVTIAIDNILKRSKTLRDLYNAGKIDIKGAMYNISDGVVGFLR